MKKLRQILVPIATLQDRHGSPLRRAAELARATGARLELFHAVTAPLTQSRRLGKRWVDVQLSMDHSVRVAQERLEQLARSKLLQGCEVQSAAVWNRSAHEAIVRRALETGANLIINGTHARGLANRLLLRHTDWELVRHSPVPVLLVKSQRQAGKVQVLAAIDPLHANAKPSRLDGEILDIADGMAGLLKGTLHAFHAYMPLSITMAAGIGEPIVWDNRKLDADYAKRVVREFTRTLRGTRIPPARQHLRIGDVARELAACARRIHATMVVMGAVSRSGLERLFVGNTAQRVLDELKCDVLVVRPPGRKSRVTARKR